MPALLRNLKVMVLDDHRNMRLLWRGILLGFGIRNVIEAGCAFEALNMLREQEVDAIFVDQHLGDLTGAEFVTILRKGADSPAPHVAMIACTADTRRATIQNLVDAGVDEILAKPVAAKQAWEKLAMVVNRRRQFVVTPQFQGPDRRRRKSPYMGPQERRQPRHEDCFID